MNYSRILHPDPRISKPTNLPQRLMSCLNYQWPAWWNASLCCLSSGQGADDYRDLHNQVVPAVFHWPGKDALGFFLLLCYLHAWLSTCVFSKYHTLKKMLIFYKMGYYVQSHKAKEINKGEDKNNCMSLTSQFLLPHHKQSQGDGSESAV